MEMDNDFWRHSLRIYKQPEVERLCLSLQDEFGLDVNVVLFCHWLGVNGLAANSKHLKGLAGQVEDWRQQVVEPLRKLRRNLQTKTDVGLVREQIKLAELKAEQHQQALIWRYYRDHKDSYIKTETAWYEVLLEGQNSSQLQPCKELLLEFPC
jgi:uncharacterized protein (TIGR02444 family)